MSCNYNNEFEDTIELLKVDNFYSPLYQKHNFVEFQEVRSYMLQLLETQFNNMKPVPTDCPEQAPADSEVWQKLKQADQDKLFRPKPRHKKSLSDTFQQKQNGSQKNNQKQNTFNMFNVQPPSDFLKLLKKEENNTESPVNQASNSFSPIQDQFKPKQNEFGRDSTGRQNQGASSTSPETETSSETHQRAVIGTGEQNSITQTVPHEPEDDNNLYGCFNNSNKNQLAWDEHPSMNQTEDQQKDDDDDDSYEGPDNEGDIPHNLHVGNNSYNNEIQDTLNIINFPPEFQPERVYPIKPHNNIPQHLPAPGMNGFLNHPSNPNNPNIQNLSLSQSQSVGIPSTSVGGNGLNLMNGGNSSSNQLYSNSSPQIPQTQPMPSQQFFQHTNSLSMQQQTLIPPSSTEQLYGNNSSYFDLTPLPALRSSHSSGPTYSPGKQMGNNGLSQGTMQQSVGMNPRLAFPQSMHPIPNSNPLSGSGVPSTSNLPPNYPTQNLNNGFPNESHYYQDDSYSGNLSMDGVSSSMMGNSQIPSSYMGGPSSSGTVNQNPKISQFVDDITVRHTGRLKFFDENQNYGFVIMDQDGSDIFVHFDDLSKANISKEFLQSAKQGTILRFAFSCMSYVGQYNKSRKAVDLELLAPFPSNTSSNIMPAPNMTPHHEMVHPSNHYNMNMMMDTAYVPYYFNQPNQRNVGPIMM